jgi:hypothetical protein
MGDKLVTTMSGRTFYDVIDDDTMATADSDNIPTGESVKAYVDAREVVAKAYTDTEVAPKKEYLTGEIADISSAASSWVVSPVAGTISQIWLVTEGAVTSDGGDAAITFEIGGTPVTGGGITIVDGTSAIGKVYTATPTAANTVTAGQAIELITDGSSTTAVKAVVIMEITPSATTTSAWKKYVTGEVANISAEASTWVVAPVAGTISKIYTVIDGAITVGDAKITLELGGTEVTGSEVTIANALSAAGVVDSATPTALNTVAAGDAIEIVADGGSTDAAKAVVLIEITPSE